MKTKQKEVGEELGYGLTKGVMKYMGGVCLYVIIFLLSWNAARNVFSWGVDDTDADAWNRSGLTLYIDHATGVQYVSNGKSMSVRIDKNGDPLLKR